jgi:prolyl 4-hydroxylase
MMHEGVSTNYPWLPHNVDPEHNPVPPQYKDMPLQPLGDRLSVYNDYLGGCVDFYGPKGHRCVQTEKERLEMSLRQPQSMNNYTKLGYLKIRAPDKVNALLKEFWAKNKDKQKPEQWPVGNIYTNHWASPSTMVSVEDASLEGGGYVLKQHIWNAARYVLLLC